MMTYVHETIAQKPGGEPRCFEIKPGMDAAQRSFREGSRCGPSGCCG